MALRDNIQRPRAHKSYKFMTQSHQLILKLEWRSAAASHGKCACRRSRSSSVRHDPSGAEGVRKISQFRLYRFLHVGLARTGGRPITPGWPALSSSPPGNSPGRRHAQRRRRAGCGPTRPPPVPLGLVRSPPWPRCPPVRPPSLRPSLRPLCPLPRRPPWASLP